MSYPLLRKLSSYWKIQQGLDRVNQTIGVQGNEWTAEKKFHFLNLKFGLFGMNKRNIPSKPNRRWIGNN